jgi:hypothetical protein
LLAISATVSSATYLSSRTERYSGGNEESVAPTSSRSRAARAPPPAAARPRCRAGSRRSRLVPVASTSAIGTGRRVAALRADLVPGDAAHPGVHARAAFEARAGSRTP